MDDAPVRGLRQRRGIEPRYRYLFDQGQTGLSVAFDLPTQMGRDSDHPLADGEVGRVGVPICSLADMETLLAELPLDKISTSMTINATASILLALYLVTAERRGVSWSKVNGTIQNDVLKEYVARGTYIYPPRGSMRIITDIFSFATKEVPNWNTISISGYHIREAGSTAAQELAFTIADGIAYVDAALKAGLADRRVREPAVVLLQRAQQLLRRGREIPRGAPAVGENNEGALRREGRALDDDALSCADRRLDAHRAAGGQQRRARDDAGARRGARRRAIAAHQLQG